MYFLSTLIISKEEKICYNLGHNKANRQESRFLCAEERSTLLKV